MRKFIFQLLISVLALTAQAQKVSNIRAEQRGQDLVVFYTLETSSPCEVSLLLSQDNGSTWGSRLKNVSGDAGKNITAGEKQITWKVLEEREQLVGDRIKFKVIANARWFEPEMVIVDGSTFQMGSTNNGDYEKPMHEVNLSSYSIGKFEVTQAQWKAVMGSNPSFFQGCDQCPVDQVSYNAALLFIERLNQITGRFYRLPSEAEWEFAAMGGKKSKGFIYSGSNNIDDVAWYDANSVARTNEVGKKKPNELGIYDMSGNVQELCVDFQANFPNEKLTNPFGPDSGPGHIMRGGGYNVNGAFAQSKVRNNIHQESVYSNVGLRLVHPIYDLKTIEPEMVFVEGGTFQVEGNSGEEIEKLVHAVTLSPFKIAKYEVTQAQWKAVMGTNPSQFSNCDKCPVESVSWIEVQKFIERLNNLSGKSYRLPSEAEWEYAARGGKKPKSFEYSGADDFKLVSWVYENSDRRTHEVGTAQPNDLNLYDMTGNVWEACLTTTSDKMILKGGSWETGFVGCSISKFLVAERNANWGKSVGFRLVLPIE
jgi:formylglycine-generating enzyme required for sulfatase activity